MWAKMTKEQRNEHIDENAKNRIFKYCKKTGHADRNCEVLAASVKAETERKIVAMTWQDDYNDEDPDTQTVYTIQSESVLSHDNI